MIDPIIEWFLKAIPSAYIANVLTQALAIFSIVQILKISWRYTYQKPSEGFIHFLSVVTAAVVGLWVGTGSTIVDRLGSAAVAWLVTFVVAKYGMAILKWKWPTLWAAVNLERRRRHQPSPDGKDKRGDDP